MVFRHSKKYSAMELIDRIMTQMDQDEIPINIMLGLSKAFDTTDHLILIDKVKYFVINGSNLNLFSGYLNNRKQYIEIDNIKSNMFPITIIIIISMILYKPVKCLILPPMLMTQPYLVL